VHQDISCPEGMEKNQGRRLNRIGKAIRNKRPSSGCRKHSSGQVSKERKKGKA